MDVEWAAEEAVVAANWEGCAVVAWAVAEVWVSVAVGERALVARARVALDWEVVAEMVRETVGEATTAEVETGLVI